jgi:hypothetical protein
LEANSDNVYLLDNLKSNTDGDIEQAITNNPDETLTTQVVQGMNGESKNCIADQTVCWN